MTSIMVSAHVRVSELDARVHRTEGPFKHYAVLQVGPPRNSVTLLFGSPAEVLATANILRELADGYRESLV